MMNEQLKKIIGDYLATRKTVLAEKAEREQITLSDGYKELSRQIDALMHEQTMMLHAVPDSSEEHQINRTQLFGYLNENQITRLPEYGCIVKTSTKKTVNTTKVLRALGGDMDQFFLLANVTQTALKEYGDDHPELKEPFKGCVETDAVIVTEVIPVEP